MLTLRQRYSIFEIFDFKNAVTLKLDYGSVEVIGNVTMRPCDTVHTTSY